MTTPPAEVAFFVLLSGAPGQLQSLRHRSRSQIKSGKRTSLMATACRWFWPNLFLGRWLKGLAFQKSEK
jgi:hypothetical protein